jgi:catechol 1,2-dioxygenase
MLIESPESQLLNHVLASYRDTPDTRLREIMGLLSRHLFAFVQDARLSKSEWSQAIGFLTAVGKACSATHQEFILLSDVLGVSTLVEIATQGPLTSETVGTVLGPVYRDDSPRREHGASLIELDDGGQRIDVWGCASNGLYPSQDPAQPSANLRGIFTADRDGGYRFITLRPSNYSVPTNGPVGALLLRATRRSPGRAAHLHLWVRAPGHRAVVTHIFDAASSNLATDAAFSVSSTLVRRMEPAGQGPAPVRFDITLAPD